VGGNGCRGETNPGAIPVNEDSVRDHIFPIQAAIALTSHFSMARDSFDRQIPVLESGISMGQAEALKRDAIAVLLNQRDSLGREASGIRIYYGPDRNRQIRMVLVPNDNAGNDMNHELIDNKTVLVPRISRASAFSRNGQTNENGQRCPAICDNGTSGLGGGGQ